MFFLLRALNIYGDPDPWTAAERGPLYSFLSFLNLNKYPPSLLYLLMTIGPALLVLPLLERAHGVAAHVVGVFGRVPLFFYLLHIPVIHTLFSAWAKTKFGFAWGLLYTGPLPPAYTPSLLRVYAVWIGVLLALYWPCRWFAMVKQRNKANWLSYL